MVGWLVVWLVGGMTGRGKVLLVQCAKNSYTHSHAHTYIPHHTHIICVEIFSICSHDLCWYSVRLFLNTFENFKISQRIPTAKIFPQCACRERERTNKTTTKKQKKTNNNNKNNIQNYNYTSGLSSTAEKKTKQLLLLLLLYSVSKNKRMANKKQTKKKSFEFLFPYEGYKTGLYGGSIQSVKQLGFVVPAVAIGLFHQ